MAEALSDMSEVEVPSAIEAATDVAAIRLEPRGVEVTSLVRLPKLRHTVRTVPYLFNETVGALLHHTGNFLSRAGRRAQLTVVVELAEHTPKGLSATGAGAGADFVLVRILTTGIKVSLSALEGLFQPRSRNDAGDPVGDATLADVVLRLGRIGGAVGASAEGDRMELWCSIPDALTEAVTPVATPTPTPVRPKGSGGRGPHVLSGLGDLAQAPADVVADLMVPTPASVKLAFAATGPVPASPGLEDIVTPMPAIMPAIMQQRRGTLSMPDAVPSQISDDVPAIPPPISTVAAASSSLAAFVASAQAANTNSTASPAQPLHGLDALQRAFDMAGTNGGPSLAPPTRSAGSSDGEGLTPRPSMFDPPTREITVAGTGTYDEQGVGDFLAAPKELFFQSAFGHLQESSSVGEPPSSSAVLYVPPPAPATGLPVFSLTLPSLGTKLGPTAPAESSNASGVPNTSAPGVAFTITAPALAVPKAPAPALPFFPLTAPTPATAAIFVPKNPAPVLPMFSLSPPSKPAGTGAAAPPAPETIAAADPSRPTRHPLLEQRSRSTPLIEGNRTPEPKPRRASAGNRHGRANIKHAHKAALELGLNPELWGVKNQSSRVDSCRPHSVEFRVKDLPPGAWENVFSDAEHPERFQDALALLILPNAGSVAAVSEYMGQWGVAYEAAKTLKEGIVRFKERLHKMKQNGKKRESIVMVDIDGPERVPEAMLIRKNIRFIFICKKETQRQFLQGSADGDGNERPWFETAHNYTLLCKPVKREELKAAVMKERQRQPRHPSHDGQRSPHRAKKRTSPLSLQDAIVVRSELHPETSILLADDTETNIIVARSYFENMGIAPPFCVRNGQECIDAYVKDRDGPRQFQMILMDCMMPKVNGFQATAAIRQMEQERGDPTIPIVAMTGLEGDQELIDHIAAGTMNDQLMKPFGKMQLLSAIQPYLPLKP